MFTTYLRSERHSSTFCSICPKFFFNPRDALLLQPFLTNLLGTGTTTLPHEVLARVSSPVPLWRKARMDGCIGSESRIHNIELPTLGTWYVLTKPTLAIRLLVHGHTVLTHSTYL